MTDENTRGVVELLPPSAANVRARDLRWRLLIEVKELHVFDVRSSDLTDAAAAQPPLGGRVAPSTPAARGQGGDDPLSNGLLVHRVDREEDAQADSPDGPLAPEVVRYERAWPLLTPVGAQRRGDRGTGRARVGAGFYDQDSLVHEQTVHIEKCAPYRRHLSLLSPANMEQSGVRARPRTYGRLLTIVGPA
ncbi:hypothetical protein [Rhodococcus opacus]|uniref:hypothetical protein n=1 Tax=Rhodococcus opacus TaxID=37919 RepID=UPI0022360EB3|nr:hypothetical protein [Rhodococcus opacus]UZG60180.1 hypothetical protein ONE62_41525 [Rhodococcus opacus]